MRVIFHIGQQKTGTSSLQGTMRLDRERLKAARILFPLAGRDRAPEGHLYTNHNGLVNSLDEQNPLGWQPLSEIRRELAAEIEEMAPSTVIISAETGFLVCERGPQVLQAFDELVPGDVEIVCYLRRPDTYLSSRHKQLIRNGRGVEGLHTEKRLDQIEGRAITRFDLAVKHYADRYGSIRLFNYDKIDDTIGHFYPTILGLEAPTDTIDANPSLPDVFVDLARQYTMTHGRMRPRHVQALLAFGSREKVDLLGVQNRARVLEMFEPQNAYLGELAGQAALFDDLEKMLEPPAGSIPVDEANARYEEMFRELEAGPSVFQLRRDCLVLEAEGRYDAAGAVFRGRQRWLDGDQLEWFSQDLAASSGGAYHLEKRRYAQVESRLPRLLRGAAGRSRRFVRAQNARWRS